MDLFLAIEIDEGSYAGDLTKLDLPSLLAKAINDKLKGTIYVPPAGTLKVVTTTAIYNNWPPKSH